MKAWQRNPSREISRKPLSLADLPAFVCFLAHLNDSYVWYNKLNVHNATFCCIAAHLFNSVKCYNYLTDKSLSERKEMIL